MTGGFSKKRTAGGLPETKNSGTPPHHNELLKYFLHVYFKISQGFRFIHIKKSIED